ncbi:hypothetical protein [Yersinia phage fHe-Yen9-03]|uniref:Uncharacterized protein n=1 Tax=Yersinia phage fHe-Yen9-03 TaxID=2052743 RepID=A0A2C9CY16_9CAUD|nr:hypothetical protein [Yersinia phage fHe-Yen9-03]
MTIFVILGMLLLFLFGLAATIGSIVLIFFSSMFGGKVSTGELLFGIFWICVGSYCLYYVFSNINFSINITG